MTWPQILQPDSIKVINLKNIDDGHLSLFTSWLYEHFEFIPYIPINGETYIDYSIYEKWFYAEKERAQNTLLDLYTHLLNTNQL